MIRGLVLTIAWMALIVLALPLILPPSPPLMRPPLVHYGAAP